MQGSTFYLFFLMDAFISKYLFIVNGEVLFIYKKVNQKFPDVLKHIIATKYDWY